jgi:HEPN domain-containing protein
LPRAKPQSRPAGPAEAQAYLDKAQEFLRAARDSLELGNNTAAVGNAVHAGIAAADAISAIRTRTVWRGEHAQAAGHLETIGEEGKQAARHLRRLLPMKTRAEYDPAPMRAADAKTAVQAAERIVALAVQALASAPPPKKGEIKRPSA